MRKYVFCLMLCSLMSVTGYAQRFYAADNESSETATASGDKVTDCKCKGVPLYGKVKFVNSFPDFKVKIVESFPDLKVKIVDAFPDACGKWKIVDAFPDFTVQIVESFPDFTIKMVESFPGMP